ncbi:PIN domain-containing protein [Rhizobium sp. GR12]|uniref:PIN domain-containing protein n=1 Tax=Rhizobium sp. GR12 TaxID=3053925 RepID=UPI002FBDB0B7
MRAQETETIYVLDTNVIVRNPEIMARVEPPRLVFPSPVLRELFFRRDRGGREELLAIINRLISKGARQIGLDPETPMPSELLDSSFRLDTADIEIAAIAKHLADRSAAKVEVVTADQPLRAALTKIGIQSQSPVDVIALLREIPPDPQTEETVRRVVSADNAYVWRSVIAAVVCAAAGAYYAWNFVAVTKYLPAVATVVGIPVLGVLLFWLRERFRLTYGIAEFAFGVFGAIAVFLPNFDYSALDQKSALQIAGSLYVIVRGMDNVGKGLEGTRWNGFWKSVFRKG